MKKTSLIILMLLGASLCAQAQQWTSQGNDIQNTNAGSVVIGGPSLGDHVLVDYSQPHSSPFYNGQVVVQPFSIADDAPFHKVRFYVYRYLGFKGSQVTVSLQSSTECPKTGEFGGQESELLGTIQVAQSGWHEVNIPSGVALKPGSTYGLVFNAQTYLDWGISSSQDQGAIICGGGQLAQDLQMQLIRTVSATHALEVKGTVEADTYRFADGTEMNSAHWQGTNSQLYTDAPRVGIGVSNPQTALHLGGDIRGAAQDGSLRISTVDGYVEIGPRNNNLMHFITNRNWYYFNKGLQVNGGQISSHNTADLKLQTATQTRLTILNANGNVGIGKTNPGYSLDVNGTINANAIRVNGALLESTWNENGDNFTTGTLLVGDSEMIATNRQMNVVVPNSVTMNGHTGIVIENKSDNQYTNGLRIGGAATNPFNNGITSSGDNVGVIALGGGITSSGTVPGTGLYAKGTQYSIYAVGDMKVEGTVDAESIAADNLSLDRLGMGTTNPQEIVELRHSAEGEAKIRYSHPSQTGYFTAGLNGTGDKWQIKRNGLPAISVEQINGSNHSMVIIGSGFSAQDGVELRGNVLVRANSWEMVKPDYVFQDDYELMSLDQLREFIALNGHLPGVTSAEEEVKNGGYNLTESMYQQLEKIEELTLYVLQLQEQLEAQAAEIDQLKKEATQ